MNQNNQSFLKVVIVAIILAAIVGTVIIVIGANDGIGGKIFTLAFSLIFYTLTGACGYAILNKHPYQIIGGATVGVSAVAFLMTVILSFAGKGIDISGEGLGKTMFAIIILAIALAHISFLFHINARNKYASLARTVAVVFISVFTLMLIVKFFDSLSPIMMFTQERPSGMMTFQLIGASLVIDLAATALVPLCNKLYFSSSATLELSTPELVTPPDGISHHDQPSI